MGMTPALITLGSNLGDRRATFKRAIADLDAAPGVVVRAVSRYHTTAPVGGPGGQGAFLNAAAALEVTLDPFELHRLLLEIERRAGRVREVRWDARTLDLDLILFGDRIIDSPDLTVPHPRFAVRRFVLAPMAKVAPHARDPITHRTVRELLAQLDRRPGLVAIDRGADPGLARSIALDVAERLDAGPPLDLHQGISAGDRDPNELTDSERYELTLERLDRIEATARLLDAERTRVRKSAPSSWLVSDCDLSRELDRASMILFPEPPDGPTTMAGNPRRLLIRAAEVAGAIQGAPSPTVAVILGWDRPYRDLGESSRGGALLVPESGDREGIVSEVLAACEASRSGSGSA
ncbi:2-amino-4-hydroxy-6-hydroxymethyldihydropteridine diphosphokinase [Tautonia plasticadhaerens]|uniref:2-amino-4-hydroxy-6-hydroxymethyldihydropteridine pyrophosphokinase n=1 Tax=Tautonia plasticadhaerens TaxID=2527974 RepID=A0A518H9R1_9BACT|nr:2-amino-4-hydroxy-6-hydroxymethyldihydropteridine diphosphokinase [Tautonia plasticadhaerens]QDV37476.1 Bifunctional folate synthesis protein [Tautonia plasticadhaerens]